MKPNWFGEQRVAGMCIEEWAYVIEVVREDIRIRKRHGLKTEWEESIEKKMLGKSGF